MINVTALIVSLSMIFSGISAPAVRTATESARETARETARISAFSRVISEQTRVRQTEIRYDFDKLRPDDYIAEPSYYGNSYTLSPEERDLVERMVMHEAGWCPDYRLLILTAQCIRNWCELKDVRPAKTYSQCGYAVMSYSNPRSRKAVCDVFDRGIKCVEEDIFCYYNCKMASSPLHESQRLAVDIDGNRFFY